MIKLEDYAEHLIRESLTRIKHMCIGCDKQSVCSGAKRVNTETDYIARILAENTE